MMYTVVNMVYKIKDVRVNNRERKKSKKIHCIFQIETKLHFNDNRENINAFKIIGVLMLSFGGLYLYKMCMMWKLHKNI